MTAVLVFPSSSAFYPVFQKGWMKLSLVEKWPIWNKSCLFSNCSHKQVKRHLRNSVCTANLQFSATAESNTSETRVLIFTCIWPKLLHLWIIQICNYCIWYITGYNCGNEKQCSSAADCICLPNHKDINLKCSHWWSTLQPLIKILASSCSSIPLQSKFHGVF